MVKEERENELSLFARKGREKLLALPFAIAAQAYLIANDGRMSDRQKPTVDRQRHTRYIACHIGAKEHYRIRDFVRSDGPAHRKPGVVRHGSPPHWNTRQGLSS